MKVKLTVEYDGTEYCGWQIQPNGVTVQQCLESAIEKLTGERVCVIGSGRTDSGVHAKGQVAHFDTECTIPPERIALAINTHLPDDIRVVRSERVADDFHARFCAKNKTYCYKMYLSETIRPLLDRYAARVTYPVDLTLMQTAAELFVGEHDFCSFMASGSEVKDTVRTIYSASVKQVEDEIYFTVCGNGFLYNMVRIMVGTLVEIGAGRIDINALKRALNGGDRSLAGKTMPPRGLTLMKVEY